MSKKLYGGLAAAAAIAAVLVTPSTAGASLNAAPAANKSVVGASAGLSPDVARTMQAGPDAHQQALGRYWTPARMKAARPDSQLPAVQAAAAKAAGTPRSAAPAAKPQGPAGRIAPAAPQAIPKIASKPAGGQQVTPQSYNPNYPVGHPVARTLGKVFFTSFGLNYVCSATIVNSEGRSEVWTAGHCVSDGGAWNTNWAFVPNYANGWAPYGYWYAKQLWTTGAWFNNNNDFANDVGAAVMWRNSGGWRITDYLGGQGLGWNAPNGYVYAFGYPQAPPYNGQTLVAEQGSVFNGGGGTVFMVNAMTGGSSGGGWLNWFDGQWGYINGHNDFKYSNLPQYMYSPYYGNQVASLFGTVRGISS
jgi:hypothetical protein